MPTLRRWESTIVQELPLARFLTRPPPAHLVMGLLLITAAPAAHGRCADALSPCFAADAQWPIDEPGPLRTLSVGARVPGYALRSSLEYLHRPLVVDVASPDPDGRGVDVVESMLVYNLSLVLAVSDRAALTVGLPTAPWRAGAGVDALRSTAPDRLPTSAVFDPRVGATLALGSTAAWAARARARVSLPLGDEQSLAGAAGRIAEGAIQASWQTDRLVVAALAGARLRGDVRFGDTLLGDQALSSIGAVWRISSRPALLLGGEVSVEPALQTLSTRTDTPPPLDGESVTTRWVPAEWSATVQLAESPAATTAVGLSIGGGLPLSSREIGAPRYSLAAGTPALRAALTVGFNLPDSVQATRLPPRRAR